MLLPAAFRSLSRPSSASGAKASALCSYSLNLLARLLDPRLRCCSSLIARLAGTPKSFASPKLSLLLSLFRENLLVLFSTLEIEVITLFLFQKD